jgi:hypothetical protein
MYADKVETKLLIIKNPENPDGNIVANATKDGVGLWLTQGKHMVSVYNLKDQLAIGIYADKLNSKGMTIALALDGDNPQIQLVNSKGEVKELGFTDFE